MPETFFILQKKTDNHGQFANLNYHRSHPHLYLGRRPNGTETLIMSRVADYKLGTHVVINGLPLAANSKYYVDDSPMRLALASPAPVVAPPPPPGIAITKEIMVALEDVRLRGKFTEAVGTIFYLPDNLFTKTQTDFKAAVKEGERITILTTVPFDELEKYRTFLQRAYGFANLRDVRLAGVLPGSTTITAEHTAPARAGYVSQQDLDNALRP